MPAASAVRHEKSRNLPPFRCSPEMASLLIGKGAGERLSTGARGLCSRRFFADPAPTAQAGQPIALYPLHNLQL
jgi:hypothetical protein